MYIFTYLILWYCLKFTGEEDAVRCHYCDGGLREWEPGKIFGDFKITPVFSHFIKPYTSKLSSMIP